MAQSMRLLVKTSEVNAIPQASDLISRELAFSFVSDGLFIKYPDGSVRQINGGTSGSTTWGSIIGNVSDSAALTNALNQKQDLLVEGNGITISGNTISVDYTTIANKPALGNSASMNVGTTAGTVAAGNHTHSKASLGLGNVDNTSDLNKPLSTAMLTALANKQDVLIPGANITIEAGVISATGGGGGGGASVTWDGVIGKPATFPPSTHGHNKTDVGLGNVDNTSDLNKPISVATQNALDAKIGSNMLGVPSGVATLNSGGKLNSSQIPTELSGAVRYQGGWNAASNTPAIPVASAANKGFYYEVSSDGTTTIDGISTWVAGDWIISNGTSWDRVQTAGSVTSVAGKTGAVTLVKADVGLGSVDNTSDLSKPISTATQVALNSKVNTSSVGVASGVASLDATGKVPSIQLPLSATSALTYQGTWDASVNNPPIPPAGVGNRGYYYIVSASGSTDINGISTWDAGDWITSIGTSWTRVQTQNKVQSVNGKVGAITLQISDIPNLQDSLNTAGSVTSVAGKTGVVTLQISDVVGLQAAINAAGVVQSVAGRTGTVTLAKADVGLGNVDNTSDLNKPISIATQAALDTKASTAIASTTVSGLMSSADKTKLNGIASGATANQTDTYLLTRTNHIGTQAISTVTGLQAAIDSKENSANKGAANGYAPLDSGSKIPLSYIPESVTGALVYQGTWDALTNSPTIPAAAPGNKGFYYKVSVAGSTNIDGINGWNVGDWIVSNGSVWERIQTQDSVSSVAGKTGAVTLTKSDVGLGSVDNTSDANKPISIATQAALDTKAGTTLVSGSNSGLMSAADKTKLDGIANNATQNATDFYLLNRTNHTGTQPMNSISGLQAALDAKQNSLVAGAGISIVNSTISVTGGSTSAVKQAGTAMLNNVTSSTTSTTILSANASRLGMVIVNDSNQPMYVAFAPTASTTAYSIVLQPADTYETSSLVYTGAVSAIWSGTPTGAARITELTA